MAASDHLGPQFGEQNRAGTDYYPKHAQSPNATGSGPDTGKHVRTTARGGRVASRGSGEGYAPIHAAKSHPGGETDGGTQPNGYIGRHSSSRKERVMHALRNSKFAVKRGK